MREAVGIDARGRRPNALRASLLALGLLRRAATEYWAFPPSAREKHTDEKADPGGDKRDLNGLLPNLPVG